MVLGIGVAGAVFTTVLSGQQGAPDALIQAVDAGLLVAAGVSVLGALASAVRSGR
jgi:hypothetical protein